MNNIKSDRSSRLGNLRAIAYLSHGNYKYDISILAVAAGARLAWATGGNSMSDRIPSSYRNRLAPWCIIRLLPKMQLPQMQRIVVARFRNRNDAEAHLNALKQMNPTLDHAIVFDPLDEELGI
jgi:hypothetical protein